LSASSFGIIVSEVLPAPQAHTRSPQNYVGMRITFRRRNLVARM
jgi:hypothetical protein